MRCDFCSSSAVYKKEKYYCKDHFIKWFEKKVHKTIEEHKLIDKKDKIAVAASGGKDSTTILHILNKNYTEVEAIVIDEGTEYRKNIIRHLENYCIQNRIKLNIYSFSEFFGFNLGALSGENMCVKCGTLRRHIINKKAQGYDKLVTGHNLDDEAQNILMNLCKSNISSLRRLGPVSGETTHEKFVQRVKPLYFCSEKEILIYSYLKGFYKEFPKCPYSHTSFRNIIRKELNIYEQKNPFAKENFVKNFLKLDFGREDGNITLCSKCGEPSSNKICNACKIISNTT